MRREATTTIQPNRPRTGRRVSDEVGAATAHLKVQPDAVDVFDAFQGAGLCNKATATPRRQERPGLRRSADEARKGTMQQWLRPFADLRRQEAKNFRRLLPQDPRTAKAWASKEIFQRIGSHPSVSGAMRFANDWAEAVAPAGIRPMIRAAETVKHHLWGIAGSVRNPITTAAGEGAHSTIQGIGNNARELPNSASPSTSVRFHPCRLQLKPS